MVLLVWLVFQRHAQNSSLYGSPDRLRPSQSFPLNMQSQWLNYNKKMEIPRENFKFDDAKLGDGNYGFVFEGQARLPEGSALASRSGQWTRVAIKTTKDISVAAERATLLSEMK